MLGYDEMLMLGESGPTVETVQIGTQTWMLKNLDIDDGGGGIYAYNNNESNVVSYGRLYTWDAAMRIADSFSGFHLPLLAEYTTLFNLLGAQINSGGPMKEIGTTFWTTPNTGATNSSGFSDRGSGFMTSAGAFSNILLRSYKWTASESSSTNAYFMFNYYLSAATNVSQTSKLHLMAVRLIKD